MKLWILRRLTWFSLRCGIYYLWSRIYQRLFESTWLDYTKVPLFPSVGAIEDCVEKMKWRPDKWWMFWDAVSAPGATWARYFEGKEAGDCLPEGTLLLTSDYSFVRIEDLRPGAVIVGDGEFTRVIGWVDKGVKPVLEFGLSNGCVLRCTGDHRLFLSNGSVVRAKDVGPGDELMYPRSKFPMIGDDRSEDEAWLHGYYVADGWNERYRFALSGQDGCGKEASKRRAVEILRRLGVRIRWARKYISVNDARMAVALHDEFGSTALNKWLRRFSFDERTVRAFLDGLSADASRSKTGTLTYGTISWRLALQIRVMYRMLGISTHVRRWDNHGGFGSNPIWRVTPRERYRGIKCRVKWVRDGSSVRCYDIETESKKIYLPESDVVVHNCDDISLAAATALREWLRHHRMHVEVTGLYLLTVPWLGRDGKVGGHSVCAISYVDVDGSKRWAHWSNWNRILWGRETVEDVVREILRGNYSLGWALADLDLRLVRYGGWENP